jgi:integrase
VFTRAGSPFNNRMAEWYLEAACKTAGIAYGDKVLNEKGERVGFLFHCFRHTTVTRWIEAGFSDEIVRRASGHKSLAAYRFYAKPSPASVMMLVEQPDSANCGIKEPEIRVR